MLPLHVLDDSKELPSIPVLFTESKLPAIWKQPGTPNVAEPRDSTLVVELTYSTEMREARENWGDGPWTEEPDEIDWVDPETGIPCKMRRNQLGAWCGYIGVSPDALTAFDLATLSVHGGVTYGSRTLPNGAGDDYYWIGFDCCHAYDWVPGAAALYPPHAKPTTYRDRAYVENEIAQLIAQVKAKF